MSAAKNHLTLPLLLFALLMLSCSRSPVAERTTDSAKLLTGADQIISLGTAYREKRIALVVNQTSVVGKTHLADTLLRAGYHVKKIFSPEHGFRGDADAGATVNNDIDSKTGLRVVSLYGNTKKPSPEDLSDIDVVLFDIQDVGARFYTYLSTLHYVMEACAENNKKLIVLDRPNPNGAYVDGPILEPEFKSFVGMHPIPILHGMTLGELAQMINGEGWLAGGIKCDLQIIPIKNWTHNDPYSLPVKPSPNLPNDHAIRLYPSICLFEGTAISVGRGTQTPFEVIGHPMLKNDFQFIPIDIPGMSVNPPLENEVCHGLDLRQEQVGPGISLTHLIDLYHAFPEKEKFFIPYFEKLAGTAMLRKQIEAGMTEAEIKATWKNGLDAFKAMRSKYLLYQ